MTATKAQPDGSWIVRTSKGSIRTDWVVNAAGLWGREVAALAGLALPLQPTEHQYVLTETIPAIAARDRRLPSVADRNDEFYLRQEGQGVLVGAYERDVRLWAEDGTPPQFGHDLFADDLDWVEDNMQRAISRVPAVGEGGVKRVINGPMIRSPDANALFGPHPGVRNDVCCNGIISGFSQSGGLGLLAAEWITTGESSRDMFAWDVARFGDRADAAFTNARVRESYAHRFAIHFPNAEPAAGRPVRVRPAYETQKALGAVFGQTAGWEHPSYFADRPDVADTAGFVRQPWWDTVNAEQPMLRDRAGIIDISNVARYRAAGPGAEDWLNGVFADRMPRARPSRWVTCTPLRWRMRRGASRLSGPTGGRSGV